jgi:hypothetical protein
LLRIWKSESPSFPRTVRSSASSQAHSAPARGQRRALAMAAFKSESTGVPGWDPQRYSLALIYIGFLPVSFLGPIGASGSLEIAFPGLSPDVFERFGRIGNRGVPEKVLEPPRSGFARTEMDDFCRYCRAFQPRTDRIMPIYPNPKTNVGRMLATKTVGHQPRFQRASHFCFAPDFQKLVSRQTTSGPSTVVLRCSRLDEPTLV